MTVKKSAKEIIAKNKSKNFNTVLVAVVIVFVLNLLRVLYYGGGTFDFLSINISDANIWYIDGTIDLLTSALLSVCYYIILTINLKRTKSVRLKNVIINILILSIPNAVRMQIQAMENNGNIDYGVQWISHIFVYLLFAVSICLTFMVNVQYTENIGIIEIIKKSTAVTFKNFFKVVLFELSFILWIIVPGFILATWKVFFIDFTGVEAFNLFYPVLSFVYLGAGFYFFPYYIVSKQLFYREISGK